MIDNNNDIHNNNTNNNTDNNKNNAGPLGLRRWVRPSTGRPRGTSYNTI